MSRYRDVQNVNLFGSVRKGVQSIDLSHEAEQLSGSGDEAQSIRYVGVSKQIFRMTVETLDALLGLHPGDCGAVSFEAPSAITCDTGAPTAAKINATGSGVVTSVSGSFEAGGLASGTLNVSIPSVDGQNSPIEVSVVTPGAATALAPADFLRDIGDVVFDGGSLNEVRSIEYTEESDSIEDSAEDDKWLTYVGVTGRRLTISLVMRDIVQARGIAFGKTGILTFKVFTGRTNTGEIDPTAYKTVTAKYLTLVGRTGPVNHGDLAEITLDFLGRGVAGEEAGLIIS
jgi:hypothetical protein